MGHGVVYSFESVTVGCGDSPDDARDTTHQSVPNWSIALIDKESSAFLRPRLRKFSKLTAIASMTLMRGSLSNSNKSLFPVNLLKSALLSKPKRTPLILTKKLSEIGILVTRFAFKGGL